MGLYIYQNPETGDIKEIFQTMKEEHSYSENGVNWNRVFYNPHAVTNSLSNIDPFNKNEFINRTGQLKKTTLGDMFDLSRDLSEKRTKKMGKDPVKENSVDAYKKKTGLKYHPIVDAVK